MVMNGSMEPIYQRAIAARGDTALPRELEETVREGFVLSGERLYLVKLMMNAPTADEFEDDFLGERWVNDVYLGTKTPPSDPSWRVELLQHLLTAAKRLMSQAVATTPLPVQIVVCLQSDPDNVDPECDFASGSLHVHLIRAERDDLSHGVEGNMQPVLIFTAAASAAAN